MNKAQTITVICICVAIATLIFMLGVFADAVIGLIELA